MIEATPEEFENTVDFDVKIWQANHVRTHWLTTSEFFVIDNCQVPLKMPVAHVVSQEEQYFNNSIVEQHMRVIFKDYRQFVASSKAHTPSILADKKAMGVLLPPGLRRLLGKS